MKTLKTTLLFSIILCTVSCMRIQVNYDYDKNVNFNTFKTYNWMPIPRSIEMNDLIIKRIKNAVDHQLQTKGFREVSENPDFLIAIHITTQQKINIVDWGYSYGPYWRRGYPYGGVEIYQYQEGTLIIDVINAAKKELVWRGSATAVSEPDLSPDKRTQKINKAVAKIMEKFPPR